MKRLVPALLLLAALAVPHLAGGEEPVLRKAAPEANAFFALTLRDVITRPADYEERVNNLIYTITGTAGIAPDARGPNIDARQLAALEAAQGQVIYGGYVLYWGSLNVHREYQRYYNHVFSTLCAQSACAALFTGRPAYDPRSDAITGITGLNTSALYAAAAAIQKMPDADVRKGAWKNIIRVVDGTVGVNNIPAAGRNWVSQLISASDANLSLDKILFFLRTVDITASPGHDYANRVLGVSGHGQDITSIVDILRLREPKSKQIAFSDVATEILKDCCKTRAELLAYLKLRGFVTQELAVTPQAREEVGTDRPYSDIIRADRTEPYDLFDYVLTLLAGHIPNRNTILLYILARDDGAEWSFALTQKW